MAEQALYKAYDEGSTPSLDATVYQYRGECFVFNWHLRGNSRIDSSPSNEKQRILP